MDERSEPAQARRPREVWELVEEVRQVARALEDFQDPSQEWRRLFAELFGTFLLVLVAAGGGMMGRAFPDTISRTAAVVAPGLMVLAIILFMGKVSGAHLNPAVSVASRCGATSPGGVFPAMSWPSWPGRPWPPGSSRASSMSRRPAARPTRRQAPRPWTRS